jgi:hypothetical protein
VQSVFRVVNKGFGRCTRWYTLAKTAAIVAAAVAKVKGKVTGRSKSNRHTSTTNGACNNSDKQAF